MPNTAHGSCLCGAVHFTAQLPSPQNGWCIATARAANARTAQPLSLGWDLMKRRYRSTMRSTPCAGFAPRNTPVNAAFAATAVARCFSNPNAKLANCTSRAHCSPHQLTARPKHTFTMTAEWIGCKLTAICRLNRIESKHLVAFWFFDSHTKFSGDYG